jgi:serine/threonine-protein kinase
MDPKRHEQVKQLFLAACEVEPSQVAALLDRACAGDTELRGEVESLLGHHRPETTLRFPVVEIADKAERFPPGMVLAGRYRILGPLGRGGMGDVYRADDLKLDQAVALKFLSPLHAADSLWLRSYENEVRLARRVTHPNVLRVHDIVETQGEVFISMEYVDGEDLFSLLRRIGRLPGDKAIEVARQLCAGLGAAHDQGVLHRDLKPSNIMIDGRGHVRIADFGIAALAAQEQPGGMSPGTPVYMAPELFEGECASVRSDLYGLGMVLYQAVTGKEPFEGKPPTTPGRPAEPVQPSTLVPYVEPALESAILRCMDAAPAKRPESAHAVAAALPGGDPLQSALAAGVTPSPSMVAAAGGGVLSLRAAVACLAAGLLALCLVVALADRTFFLPQAGLVKSPAVLADRAEQVLEQLGYDLSGKEHTQGFAIEPEYLSTGSASPRAAYFWYRVGGERHLLPTLLGEPPAQDAPHAHPSANASARPDAPPHDGSLAAPADTFDSAELRLSGDGQLVSLAVTSHGEPPSGKTGSVDWSKVFKLAGLDIRDFETALSQVTPPVFASSQGAWKGHARDEKTERHVEGASLGGRVVFFQVGSPSDVGGARSESRVPARWRIPVRRMVLNLLALVGAGSLAWHNWRTGRGDHRGARRLALFVLFLGLADWLLGERHSAVFAEELASLYLWTARAILTASIAWLCYFAVEPYVRKFWPPIMITWSRVLMGKFRDPLLGRDVLIGGTCGILLLVVLQLDNLLPGWLGGDRPLPLLPNAACELGALVGVRYKLGVLVALFIGSITLGLIVLLLMLLVRVAVRRPWPAAVISWLALTALQALTAGLDTAWPWLTSGIVALVVVALMARAGLVALIATAFVLALLRTSPLTADFRAWYAPACVFALTATASLLVCGFVAMQAGRPSVWRRLLD